MRRRGKARLRMLLDSFALLGRMRRGEPLTPKPAGMACAANPDAKPRAKRLHYVILPKAKGHGFVSLGPMQAREVVQQWVKMADERAAKPIGHRNRRRYKAALTAIGEKVRLEKLPKLPRKYHWQA